MLAHVSPAARIISFQHTTKQEAVQQDTYKMSENKEDVSALNWNGRLPVLLTLASTSLSSPTLPPPVHVLVPRNSYLHTGLREAVQRLHRFAPASPTTTMFHVREPSPGKESDEVDEEHDNNIINNNHINNNQVEHAASDADGTTPWNYPVCWFEDEDTHLAVRWHLFAGVLFDVKQQQQQQANSNSNNNNTWRRSTLPWRLKLHFNNYPAAQILPLDAGAVLATVQASFKHSLKQSLTLQQGNSKGAMNVTKESHGLLWEAVLQSNLQIYRRVENFKLYKTLPIPLPVLSIPIRLFVDATAPPIQRRVHPSTTPTLGDLLHQWLFFEEPHHHGDIDDKNSNNNEKPIMGCCCRVCGVEPPWSTPLLELWHYGAHPDQFLYISVRAPKSAITTTTTTTTTSAFATTVATVVEDGVVETGT